MANQKDSINNSNNPLDIVAIKDAAEKLNAKYGKGTAFIASKGLKDVEFTSTGFHELDAILGGGLPKGKISMIYGPEGSGKTSFFYHMMSKYPLAVFIDAERSFSVERAATFGINLDKMIMIEPMTGEQALSAVIEFASAGAPLIMLDSIAALVPKKEFELEDDTERVSGMALTAGLLNRKVFAINNICHKMGTTVIFSNQVRDSFNNFNPFAQTDQIPGGHALKHVCHVIIKIARKDRLKVSEQVVGQTCRLSTGVKNRSAAPFQDCDVPLIYDKGFVSLDNLEDAKKEARKKYLTTKKQSLKNFIDESA